MQQISQGKFFLEKLAIRSNCGFFQHFLATFATFITRYDHSYIKFDFFCLFISLQTLYLKIIFQNELKMPFRPLCNPGFVHIF